jgi:hypothetical protein
VRDRDLRSFVDDAQAAAADKAHVRRRPFLSLQALLAAVTARAERV